MRPKQQKIRALFLSMLMIGSVLAVSIGFTGTGLAAAANDPEVAIESPADDSDLTTQPVISGSATDGSGIDKVKLKITDTATGHTWTGSQFQSGNNNATIDFSGSTSVDWSYDVYSNGITADGEYKVEAYAVSVDGNVESQPIDALADPTKVSYEVDTQAPSLTNVDVTEKNDDDKVSPGDTVKISADVTDAQSGVASVTADASVLGGSEDLTLTDGNSNNVYDATFTVNDPETGDGDVSLTVTTEDNFGQSRTASDSITLETQAADASSISVDHDFVGIVEDQNDLTISASGVVDNQGNKVNSGEADVTIGSKTYTVTVSDGEISETIDPTKISNTHSTGQATVSLGSATDTVRLMHEVQDLDKGYQVGGTPMPADNVVVNDEVNDVTAYKPAKESWGEAEELRGGEGYYIDADSSDARIGYTFDEDAEKKSDSKLLEKGYNLVGASPNMNNNANNEVGVSSDLGADLDVQNDGDVTARLPKPNTDISDKKGLDAFAESSAYDENAEAYEAYWVKIDSSGNYIRTTVEVAYEPKDQ